MKIFNIILAGLAPAVSVFVIFALTANTANGFSQIYISGVQTSGGAGLATNDFIELFNPNPDLVSLKDYKLVKRTAQSVTDSLIKSWTDDVFIPSYSFYLWANAGYVQVAVAPDVSSSATIADDNGLALRYSSGESASIIDSLSWGQTNNEFPTVSGNIPAGSSLQRQGLFETEPSYEIGQFVPRNTSVQVPPGTVITPAPEDTVPEIIVPVEYADLNITEILPNPSGTDSGHEAVEIFNTTEDIVELSGWVLSDNAQGLNGYELSGNIDPGQYKAITIPVGKFSLLNSSGEVVYLFSPDRLIKDSAAYSGVAEENKSFQVIEDEWLWSASTLGQENKILEDNVEKDKDNKVEYSNISINEVYFGVGDSTSMHPQIELYSNSDKKIDMTGWQIEISTTNLKKPSGDAWTLSEKQNIADYSFYSVELPNINSLDFDVDGKYWVLLFSPDDNKQDAVHIKQPVNKLSWSKFGSLGWEWSPVTMSIENTRIQAPPLRITEIFSGNKDSEFEPFVEIQNNSAVPVFLGNIKIQIGNRSAFLPDYDIQAGEYFAISGDVLPATLAGNKKISVVDANNKVIETVSLPVSKTGSKVLASYIVQENKVWVWTGTPSPNEANVLAKVLIEKNNISTKPRPKTVAKPKSVATKPNLQNLAMAGDPLPDKDEGEKSVSKKPVWIFAAIAFVLLVVGGIVWYSAKEPEVY